MMESEVAVMFRIKTWILTLGVFFTDTFIVFVLWNLLEPNPVYIRILETVLPGFKWLSLGHALLGMVEAFLYGTYVAVMFVPLHNFFYRRHEREAKSQPSAQNTRSMKAA